MQKPGTVLLLLIVILSFSFCYAQTITLASTNPATASSDVGQGTSKHLLYHFILARPNNPNGTVNLTSVSFETTGTYTSGDVSRFQLWYNTTDVLSSATQISSDITTSMGIGSHTFPAFSQSLSKRSTRYFWITTDIPGTATAAKTISVAAMTTANFVISNGVKAGTAYIGGVQTIVPLITLATLNPAINASNVSQSTLKNPIYRFTLSLGSAAGTVNLTAISFITTGSYQATDITRFQLWTNTIDALGTATQISYELNSSLGIGNHSFPVFTQPLAPNATRYFWLTADLSTTAVAARTMSVSAMNQSSFTMSSGMKASNAYAGGVQTFISPIITLASTNPAVPAGSLSQTSSRNPIYRFTLSRNSAMGIVNLTGLNFVTAGSYTTADVLKFQLWSNSVDVLNSATQVGADEISSLGTGNHSFGNFLQTLTFNETRYFWITTDVSSAATSGRSITVSAITATDYTITAGTKNGTASAGGVQTIIAPVITLASNNPAVAIATLGQGSAKNPVYRFTLTRSAATGAVNLTALTFTTSGTYLQTDITRYQLWTNSTDALSTASQISSDLTGSLGSGIHSFAAFTQTLPVNTTLYFWITIDVASATVSRNLTVSAMTTSDFTLTAGTKSGIASTGGVQTFAVPSVNLTTTNPAVANANVGQGSILNPIYRFTLTRDAIVSVINLTGLSFTTTGTYLASDVVRYQLWSNTTDVLNSATQISSDITTGMGPAVHSFPAFTQALSENTIRYFWITADIAGAGTAASTIAVSAMTINNFTISTGTKSAVSYAGGVQTIVPTTVTLATPNPAVPASSVGQGTVKLPVYRFSLSRNAVSAPMYLTGVVFTTTGTHSSADISRYQIWTSTTDALDSATQISSDITTGTGPASHTFNSFTQALSPSSTRYFWITADISLSAGYSGTIIVSAFTTASFTVSLGTKAGSGFAGGVQTITARTVTLGSANPSLPVANVGQDTAKYPIYRFTLVRDATLGSVNLTSVTFSSAGTYQNTDISRFQIWTNITDQLDGAVQLGNDINFSLGTTVHTFNGFSKPTPENSISYFWITADITLSAVTTRTIYVNAITLSDITLSSGTKAGIAYASGAQTITAKGWQYIKRQTINQLTNAGVGYQVRFTTNYGSGTDSGETVYLNSKCKTDFGDVRFYEGNTELKYWMESMTPGSTATFWVKLAGDLGSSSLVVDVRFGNSAAVTTSNGLNTFILFDDFNADLSKWTKLKQLDNQTISIPAGQSFLRCGGGAAVPTGTYGHTVLGSAPAYTTFQNNAVEYKFRVSSEGICEIGFRGNFALNAGTGYKARSDQRFTGGQSFLKPPYYSWNFLTLEDVIIPTIDRWYRSSITAYGNDLKLYNDGILRSSVTDISYPGAGEISLQNHYGSYTDYDWVAVRKFAGSEPSRGAWVPVICVFGELNDFGLVKAGNVSANQYYYVSGSTLSANLVLTAPRGFEISVTSGSGFGSALSLIPTNGTVNYSTIYVRFAPLSSQQLNYSITHSSSGAASQYISVHGTGYDKPIITNPEACALSDVTATVRADISTDNNSAITERGIYWSATDAFPEGTGTKVTTSGAIQAMNYSVLVSGLDSQNTYYFRAFATNAAGTSYTPLGSFKTFQTPVAKPATAVCHDGFTARWQAIPQAISYRLDVFEADGVTYVPGYQDKEVFLCLDRVEFVNINASYKYRVRANYGSLSLNSNLVEVSTTTEVQGVSASTSIGGNPVTIDVPYVEGGPDFTNNDVTITPGNTSDYDYSINVTWHPLGFEGQRNTKLVCRVSCSDNAALNAVYAINHAGMGFIPIAASYKWGSTWQSIAYNSTADCTTIEISGLQKDSKGVLLIALDNAEETLPVELTSFTAIATPSNCVRLDWATQSETGVLGYKIYRNTISNVCNAELISPLIPATNSSQEICYNFTDKEIYGNGTYYYWLQNQDVNGDSEFHGPIVVCVNGYNNDTPIIPLFTSLNKPYPNPFNPSVTISYGLAKGEDVQIRIFNNKGQLVRTLLDAFTNRGIGRITWDGTNDLGQSLSSGMYYVRMTAGKYSSSQKLILLK